MVCLSCIQGLRLSQIFSFNFYKQEIPAGCPALLGRKMSQILSFKFNVIFRKVFIFNPCPANTLVDM